MLLSLVYICGFIFLVTAEDYQTNTVDIGPQDQAEDPKYIYECMMKSHAQHKLQLATPEIRLTPHRGRFPAIETLGSLFNQRVCYPEAELGCFYRNGTYEDFKRVPTHYAADTRFLLYTFAGQTDPQLLDYRKPASLTGSSFRPELSTTVFIHGFTNSPRTFWMKDFQKAVFAAIPHGNYILVDWSVGAKGPDYWDAAANTQVAGAQTAKLIAALNTHMASSSKSFHVIGHSLGAHVAGFTGNRLIEYGHKRVGKITGLDPAGPVFANFDAGHKDSILSVGDADFVAGVHTNGVPLKEGFGLGIYRPVGDVDFYPNGGRIQPGCTSLVGDLLRGGVACNHHRSVEFIMEPPSSTCVHRTYPCDSWEMFKDGQCRKGPYGTLALDAENVRSGQSQFSVTKEMKPFCANALKVTIHLSQDSEETVGNIAVAFSDVDGVKESVEQLATDEKLSPGSTITEIIPSRFDAESLANITLHYTSNRLGRRRHAIKISELTVQNLWDGNSRICGGARTIPEEGVASMAVTPCPP